MFKKGDTVIYPIHGIGEIIEIQEIEFNGKNQKYYKIEFPNKSLSVSIPAESTEKIGLRKPLSKKILKENISLLSTTKEFKEEEYLNIDKLAQELLNSGLTKNIVQVIMLMRTLKEQKRTEGKTLTTSNRNHLRQAQLVLKQEISHVLGVKILDKYDLE